jgi:hypothetical protein
MHTPEETESIKKGVPSKEAIVTTPEEAAQLLGSDAPNDSLIFELNGTPDISKVAQIISKNQKTLRQLTLKRVPSQTSEIVWGQAKELALAIGNCQELRIFKLEHFRGAFSDAVKYIVAAIQRLRNLQHLSFQRTYLHPSYVWNLLIENLDKLDTLLTLNLRYSIVLGNREFSTLRSYTAINTSLTEINLGQSTICIDDSFAALKLGGEKTEEVVTTSKEETQPPDSDTGLHLIFFRVRNTHDITKVTRLVSKNQKTLQHLKLRGESLENIPWSQTKELAQALGGCQALRILELYNCRGGFKESIKYLVSAIQHLKNLQHLSFENTYLYPYWHLLTESLGNLNGLLSLNLDCSGILGNSDFSVLGSFIGKSTSLTELNLGQSPIWMDGFAAFAWGFAKNESNDLELLWDPLLYQSNERLYHRLTMATNWDNSSVVDASASRHLKILESEQYNEVSLQHFNTSTKKLGELYKILCQRLKREKVTKLKFRIVEGEFLDLPLMVIQISSHIATLQELEINIEFNSTKNFDWPLITNQFLAALLKKATKLHTVKLINFKIFLLKDNCTVIEALASLPALKTLELKDTYLGEAGSERLRKVLQQNTLTSLDVTNAALGSDTCFTHLKDGLRQCHSLQRLILGKSPMTGAWLRMLLDSIDRKPQPPEIVWQPCGIREMTILFGSICDKLHTIDHSIDPNALKNKFSNQDPNELKIQTSVLQRKNTPAQRGFFASLIGTNSPAETALQSQPIMRTVKGYGSTN